MGGAELLFIRCALYLADIESFDVYYVDYKKGFSREYLSLNNKINYIDYSNDNLLKLPSESLVIFQLDSITYYEKLLISPSSYKYLFWGINPMNLVGQIEIVPTNYFSVGERKRKQIGVHISRLIERGVIKFMDHNNFYVASKTFYLNSSKNCFLPVSIDNFKMPKFPKARVSESSISFLWIGRLDNDKLNTIITFMNELELFKKTLNVILYIVGSGAIQEKLERYSRNLNYKVVFLGRLRGASLDDIIDNKIDIGLGMGLSSLEIARRGRPVIVQGFLNKAYKAHVKHDYQCLNDITGYDVVSPGYYINDKINYFYDLVNKILNEYSLYSVACAQHVFENFSLQYVGPKVVDAIDEVYNNWNLSCLEEIRSIKYHFQETKLKQIIRRILRKLFVCFGNV